MNKKPKDIEFLIIAFLSNDIDKNDLDRLQSWMNESSENKKEFNQYKLLWDKSETLKLFNEIDAEKDWEKVKSKLNKPKESKIIKPAFYSIRKIAAVLIPTIIISGIGFGLYWTTPGFGRWDVVQTTDSIEEVTLPDSSKIILNRNSKIQYLKKLNTMPLREISLSGEAFFKVKHNSKQPFVVNTNEILVSVLGTEFNVNQNDEDVTVSVVSGKVKVEAEDYTPILLTKGEEAQYLGGRLSENTNPSSNHLFWFTQKLEFNQSTLSEICESLKDAYPEIKTVKFKAKKSNIKITTSFSNQPLKEVIEELHLHFGKNITFDGKVLTISE